MEIFHNLIFGFSVALTFQNLLYCFIGCFFGTLIGVLPGIGPIATIAMLMPITFVLPPVAALIMLSGTVLGCYSTIYVAGALAYDWHVRHDVKRAFKMNKQKRS